MNDNKELNDNLERLFSTIKDAYGIASMIKDIKEKEVVKKDYQIINWGEKSDYKTKDIIAVTRESDNQIFIKGDATDEGIIKSFYEEDNKLWVRTEEKGGVVSINDIQKVVDRVPLFTTEDGKDIFEGSETVWVVDPEDFACWSTNAKSCGGGCKYFSTEDKAKEYVQMNKPVLSLNDVISCSHVKNNYEGNQQFVKLKELAQSKINTQ